MDSAYPRALLCSDDPPPFRVIDGASTSPFLILCDHAGNRLPRELGDLGLSSAELESHVAWDIGVAGVAEQLAGSLGAFTILQTYSRLVIDCNRPLDSPTSIVEKSEYTVVPGNRGLTTTQAQRRADAVFWPYHRRVEEELARRAEASIPTVLIALHSFTPCFMGTTRPWQVGVLYHCDTRLAHPLLALLRRDRALVVGDNEPYSVTDHSDYGVIQYGERRGLLHVEIEIRQDLIADALGQSVWADRLAELLPRAYALARGQGSDERALS